MSTKVRELNEMLKAKGVTLIAVTKTRSNDQIMGIYNAGLRIFGENRVQELMGKKDELPSDIHWHLIGHLQKNKVKYIAPFIEMIHSVDSPDLLLTIQKEAAKHNRIIEVLIQVFVAKEETKFGMDVQELNAFWDSEIWKSCPNVRIKGIMGMATNTEDNDLVRAEFQQLKALFEQAKERFAADSSLEISVLSMGMSTDFGLAVEEGSTMVRIGSLLFQ